MDLAGSAAHLSPAVDDRRRTLHRGRERCAGSRRWTRRSSFRGRRRTMGIIAWIILGAIAGWITNMIMGGGEGVLLTIILGIVGAIVGGWLIGSVLGVADVTGLNITSII